MLNRTVLTIPARSGAEGRLYGSITTADLADEIWRTRKIRVDRRKIRLEEPIKLLGAYLVEIDVFPEVRAVDQGPGRTGRGLRLRRRGGGGEPAEAAARSPSRRRRRDRLAPPPAAA